MVETMTSPVPAPKMNDILVCSWGYDQTNIDFYMVVDVTKASVKIRKLYKKTVPGTDKVEPNTAMFNGTAILTKRFRARYDGVGYTVKISDYSAADLWDGRPRWQTPANQGH